ncbi:hypothetical protein LVQ79_10745 [Buttiauxella sp. A2-C1_F]|uniref:hypothetical protein n=1 Tax=Buttiauxella sp. A2-C1_F TaxID=2904526 RepID=UPI001E544285|nr:hypothetical protein [Buttiauxella sp. A2-C1_F]MCE0846023.1 hypothetical protein [Buttiauxella sp. A2-C1_F]
MTPNTTSIQEMIRLYTQAEMEVLQGKSIVFNGQQMTREDLSKIREGRQEWERKLATANSTSGGRSGFKLARFSR